MLCLVSHLVRSGVGKKRNTKGIVMRHYKLCMARKESERAIGSGSRFRSLYTLVFKHNRSRDVCPPVAHRCSPGCRSPRRSPQRPRFPCRQSVSSLGVPHALRGCRLTHLYTLADVMNNTTPFGALAGPASGRGASPSNGSNLGLTPTLSI